MGDVNGMFRLPSKCHNPLVEHVTDIHQQDVVGLVAPLPPDSFERLSAPLLVRLSKMLS